MEKMLVTCIFSFSDNVLKIFLYQCSYPFPKQTLVFTCLQYKSFENAVRKVGVAGNKQFLLSPQHFLPLWRTFHLLNQVCNCHLPTLSVWTGLRFFKWNCLVKGYLSNKPLDWYLLKAFA